MPSTENRSEQEILNRCLDESANALQVVFTTGSADAVFADDSAFTVGTSNVEAIGALADETDPDSVDEGDIGIVRMTLTRFLKTSLGDLLSGEDQTNNVMQVVEKPVEVIKEVPLKIEQIEVMPSIEKCSFLSGCTSYTDRITCPGEVRLADCLIEIKQLMERKGVTQ